MHDANVKGCNCQLCGPMSGFPRAQVERAFADAERRLHRVGAETVWNPVERIPASTPHEAAMAKCVRVLVNGAVDALVVLPGWEDSQGALLEVSVAHAVGVRVVDLGEVPSHE